MTQTKLTVEQLTAIEALIAKGWTQGAYARRYPSAPFDCDPTNALAQCYCLIGAAAATIYPGMRTPLDAIINAITLTNDTFTPYIHMSVHHWNDTTGRTQADVLSLIARVKADRMKEEGMKLCVS